MPDTLWSRLTQADIFARATAMARKVAGHRNSIVPVELLGETPISREKKAKRAPQRPAYRPPVANRDRESELR